MPVRGCSATQAGSGSAVGAPKAAKNGPKLPNHSPSTLPSAVPLGADRLAGQLRCPQTVFGPQGCLRGVRVEGGQLRDRLATGTPEWHRRLFRLRQQTPGREG